MAEGSDDKKLKTKKVGSKGAQQWVRGDDAYEKHDTLKKYSQQALDESIPGSSDFNKNIEKARMLLDADSDNIDDLIKSRYSSDTEDAYKRGGMVKSKKSGVRGAGCAAKGHGKMKVY